MSGEAFAGFPGLSSATAIPNLFFSAVLPTLSAPGDVLAFLWASRLIQEQRAEARFVTAGEIWAAPGAAASFTALGGGRAGLERGLLACARAGALLVLRLTSDDGEEAVYFVNNPGSRRAVARARASEIRLRPGTVALPVAFEPRPGIFRLYEEHVGTITPMVGERLLAAAEAYPAEWIEEAFREAAELNLRSWRYVERILQRWAQEGRSNETTGRDSFEEQKRRFLGAALGTIPPGR
ncbi:MAG: DnaD domain protein [Dehalococcoidia bacterium]|nr:DnaD domain protein [Dehalococcoidia bacterium]